MNTKPKPFDAVSSGTLRDIDLIESFVDCLSYYRPLKYAGLIQECQSILPLLKREPYYPKSPHYNRFMDTVSWLLNEDLFNAMDELSPKDWYFGSHPGDGGLFGYWPHEDSNLWE